MCSVAFRSCGSDCWWSQCHFVQTSKTYFYAYFRFSRQLLIITNICSILWELWRARRVSFSQDLWTPTLSKASHIQESFALKYFHSVRRSSHRAVWGMSLSAPVLGSWLRNSLEALMLSVSATFLWYWYIATSWTPVQGDLPCKGLRNRKAAKALIIIIIIIIIQLFFW
jgi:hypothetical protein